ncbi:MAG: hypothetical protein J1E57_00305 [Prevotella sp.]|nr:hypothetical protein [Prevotella sp.]
MGKKSPYTNLKISKLMGNIETFHKRWNTITNETLSSVRRQLNNVTFDISIVNRDFHSSCGEWFDGNLAPHIWFQQLAKERPELAQKFKAHIASIKISEQSVPKPARWYGYVATALSLPICYYLLCWVSEMGFVSKSVFTIGTAILVWYACQSYIKEKQANYEEKLVDLYRNQLDNHLKEIIRILS